MTLPDCHHRGEQRTDGKVRCGSDRIHHREPGWASVGTCLECPYADVPAGETGEAESVQRAKRLDCRHRGDEIRRETADLCGMAGVEIIILACDLHGECAIGRYCRKQTVRSCVACIAAGENGDSLSPQPG